MKCNDQNILFAGEINRLMKNHLVLLSNLLLNNESISSETYI